MNTAMHAFPSLAVRRAIESCLAQDFSSCEDLAVDDRPGDGAGEVGASFSNPRVQLVHYPTDRGVCPAPKSAVRASRGERLIPLDSDHEMLRGCRSRVVGYWAVRTGVLPVMRRRVSIIASWGKAWPRPFGIPIPPTGSVTGFLLPMIGGMSWLHMATRCGFAPRRFQAVICNAALVRRWRGDRFGAIQTSLAGFRFRPVPLYTWATLAVLLARSRAARLVPVIRSRRHWRSVGMAVPAAPAEISQRPDNT
jgi:hypothetical protein